MTASIAFTDFKKSIMNLKRCHQILSTIQILSKFTSLLTKFTNLKPKKPETQLKKEQIMKNVDELYEKYQNAYKNDYDADELSKAENN